MKRGFFWLLSSAALLCGCADREPPRPLQLPLTLRVSDALLIEHPGDRDLLLARIAEDALKDGRSDVVESCQRHIDDEALLARLASAAIDTSEARR